MKKQFYQTEYHGKDKKFALNNRSYYIKGQYVKLYNSDYDCYVTLYAVDAITNEKIGKCTILHEKKDDKQIYISEIKILNHNYNHCGIGTNLLHHAENIAIDEFGAKTSYLVRLPDEGYERIVTDFYNKNNYFEFTSLGHLLNLELVHHLKNKYLELDKKLSFALPKQEKRIVIDDKGETIYLTKPKDVTTSANLGEYPYYLKGNMKTFSERSILKTSFKIFAIDAITEQEIADCTMSIGKDNCAYISDINFKNKNFEHCGIATRMVRFLENCAIEQGATKANLILEDNKDYETILTKFKQKCGYPIGENLYKKLEKNEDAPIINFEVENMHWNKEQNKFSKLTENEKEF